MSDREPNATPSAHLQACAGGSARLPRRAHLLGIAGAGMRSLAEVLLGLGWKLSGSDLAVESVEFLAVAGVELFRGHRAEHVAPNVELVIASDAIPAGNPERRRAAELGIATLSYFDMLGRLMDGKRGVGVAGTHGKSTTTAMTGKVLADAGLDPTVVYGAAPLERNSGGRCGRGSLVLAEACEYRANFLRLPLGQGAILGIEPDHFDCYPSLRPLEEAFARFAAAIPPEGLLLARADCAVTRRVAAGLPCRVQTFGLEPGADWSARGLCVDRGRYAFGLFFRWRRLGDVILEVPGRHNVLNALAAAALAWENGVSPGQIVRSLGSFRGLRRRLEVVGCRRGVTLLDDYAHHPTEVAATLETVRQMYPGRRVCCVFQPHQVSRTRRLLDELAASLQNADKVLVAEIFRAREPQPAPGEVTAADLARRVRAAGGEAAGVHSPQAIRQWLENHLRYGDVLITMGAGDIGRLHDGFLDRLREDRAAG